MAKSRKEVVRDAEALKDSAQEIDGLVPVDATIKENADTIYSMRFTRGEMTALREAARMKSVKLSELIRESALEAAAEVRGKPTPRERAVEKARELVGAAARELEKI
jgi:hypothetical protein